MPVEQALRDAIADELTGNPSRPERAGTALTGCVVEDVRLEGRFPSTEVIILFRSLDRPELLFGRRERIWADDGVYATDGSAVITMNLEERIYFAPGLPLDAEPDATGVVWV